MLPSILLPLSLLALSPLAAACEGHMLLSSLAAASRSSAAAAVKAKATHPATAKTSKSTKASGKASTGKASTGKAWTAPTKQVAKKKLPAVKQSGKQAAVAAAQSAVGGFVSAGLVDGNQASAINAALAKAVVGGTAASAGVRTVTLTSTSVVVSKVVTTVARPTTVLSTVAVTRAGQNVTELKTVTATAIQTAAPVYITLTQNQTVLVPVTSVVTVSANSTAQVAALSIQSAVQSALAAANLSQSSLNADTTSALEACLTTVVSLGGMPSGYACLTSSGSNSAGLTSTLNTILEQFVGILPNTILNALFDAVTPLLTELLPASEAALVSQIEASIKSVVASLSGSSVTAAEQMEQCYTTAIQASGNTSSLACFQTSQATLATAANSVLESFVGVLPAALTTQVQNILTFNLQADSTASASLAGKVQAQISNALNSVASTLSGNAVSLAEALQGCTALLLSTGDAAAAQACITSGAAPALSATVIAGIAEQYQGYLASSFFSDLVEFSTPLLSNTTASAADVDAAFDAYFNSLTYGPAYAGCVVQVQECVTNAVRESGTIGAVCPGPVSGCSKVASRLVRGKRHGRWGGRKAGRK